MAIKDWGTLHEPHRDPRRKMKMFPDTFLHAVDSILPALGNQQVNTLIELGCGTGDVTLQGIRGLLNRGIAIERIVGVDIENAALEQFRELLTTVAGLQVETVQKDLADYDDGLFNGNPLISASFVTGYLPKSGTEALVRQIAASGAPAIISHHFGPSSKGDMIKAMPDAIRGLAYVRGMKNFGQAMKFLGVAAREAQPMNLDEMHVLADEVFGPNAVFLSPHSNVLSIAYPGRDI